MSGKETGYTYTKLVTLSGDNGTVGSTKTDFRVNMGTNMQKVARVSIASVAFPNNAYNVNDSGGGENNTFAVRFAGTVVEFEVKGGFYTTATLMSAVETAITDYITLQGWAGGVNMTQDSITQLVEAKYAAGTGPFFMSFEQADGESGIWELLGFTTLPASVASGSLEIAPDLPSLAGLKEVYLQSNALAPGNMFDKDGLQRNVLITIPITVPFGVSNVFECKVDSLCELTYLSPRSLQEVDFKLTDRKGNVVNLHGGNLIINLKVWFNRY